MSVAFMYYFGAFALQSKHTKKFRHAEPSPPELTNKRLEGGSSLIPARRR